MLQNEQNLCYQSDLKQKLEPNIEQLIISVHHRNFFKVKHGPENENTSQKLVNKNLFDLYKNIKK